MDSFISACFVHVRKPDADTFRLGLDIAQAPARQVVYIENTPMFVHVVQSRGIHGIHHQGLGKTRTALETLGLK